MTQEERWRQNYEKVLEFMQNTSRRPSKHRVEEHLMLNWYKHQKRRMLRGEMTPDRGGKFQELMAMAEKLRRLNQYAYKEKESQQLMFDL